MQIMTWRSPLLALTLTIALVAGISTGLPALADPAKAPVGGKMLACKDGGGKQGFHGKSREEMSKHFAEKLSLTEAQQTEIEGIKKAFYEANKETIDAKKGKMKALWTQKKNGEITSEAFKAQKEALKAEYSGLREAGKAMHADIKATLTPDQVKILDEMHAKHKEKWEKRKATPSQNG